MYACDATAVKTIIGGRYVLEGRLGSGGMSTVHLALDRRLERRVALKLLAEHLTDEAEFVSRFRREALAAARLVHPNIVQVFDYGVDRDLQQHFIAMEHVSGRSCAQLLREHGALDITEAVEILVQTCRSLAYAHRNGIVHRDVKPGNLLVSDSGLVKLADFGIARALDQSSITQTGSVLGTAAYLSPEQIRGGDITPRADIYSLGVVAYQLLSGRLPYETSTFCELAQMHERNSPRTLDSINPDVPPRLARAVAKAMATDPAVRPRDAQEFAQTLLATSERGTRPHRGGLQRMGEQRAEPRRGRFPTLSVLAIVFIDAFAAGTIIAASVVPHVDSVTLRAARDVIRVVSRFVGPLV
jgi:eukaryotic-like serine/threonine-protein kinase